MSEIRTVLEPPTPYKKQPSLFVMVMVENHTVLAPPTKIKKYTVTRPMALKEIIVLTGK
ncbi:hypothetical protein [Xenorhabdus bovienii]|uniref:hypothetical protein n=1 Tax=Xenorhabdus bovienii TaxID=40576 RepID=UPI0012D32425|nr:hypothetical protein [Xenorhabdus bovienii]